MPLDLQPLIDQFYDYFLDLYHKQKGSGASSGHLDTADAGEPFLAFGGIGTPLTPEMFLLADGSPSTALVREQFSGLANMLPELDGTAIGAPGLLSADSSYGALLAQAQPSTAADAATLGALKDPALRAYQEAAVEPLILGGVEYRPAIPVPDDWPLPSGDAAWSHYSYKTEAKTTVTTTPPPASAPPIRKPVVPRPLPDWRWRVAKPELRDAVTSIGTVSATVAPRPVVVPSTALPARIAMLRPVVPLVAQSPAAAASPGAFRTMARAPAMRAASPALADELLSVRGPTAAPAQPATARLIRSRLLLEKMQVVREQSQPQAVTSSAMELSFSYCMVIAKRPWVSGGFLTARNWYIPRMHAGEIASGTGQGPGSFEVMPTAALCVRDLTIAATWSAEEKAVLSAITKFGPFSLVGSKLDIAGTSLTCKGMQIVGWVMEPMPKLPPNSDPSLPVS
ncbi:MAG: hypothetical protein J0I21_17560 [Alphaproteobacteria bacterium]|nr:hypothetical protein [Alphaproteobacteria bacterium]